MHQELLLLELIPASGEWHEDGTAIHLVPLWRLGSDQFEQGGKKVGYIGHLRQYLVRWDHQPFLMCIAGITLGPGSNEGHAHTALVMGTFLTT